MRKSNIKMITVVLATLMTLAGAAISAKADLTLADNGVGYVEPTFVGSSWTLVQLNNMITVYNGGTVTPSDGHTYTVDQGTLTPNPPLPLAAALGAIKTPTVADGYGQPTATIHLGAGGYTYLSAQWDGPKEKKKTQ